MWARTGDTVQIQLICETISNWIAYDVYIRLRKSLFLQGFDIGRILTRAAIALGFVNVGFDNLSRSFQLVNFLVAVKQAVETKSGCKEVDLMIGTYAAVSSRVR